MSKMGSHDPFKHMKHKLWSKEGPKIKLAVWLPAIKSQELPRFPCVQVVCNIPLESFNKGYNFALDLISIGNLHRELWAPKVVGVPSLGISGFPLGTKCHLDVGLMEGKKYDIRGKVVASPKFGLWWVLWVWVCPWLVLAPKVFKLCTNQLVVWFVQICVSN